MYKDQLCPSPWRVPTKEDFMMYANGLPSNTQSTTIVHGGVEGWLLGGYFDTYMDQMKDYWRGYYWSSSEYNDEYAHNVWLDSSYFYPYNTHEKGDGHSLRCVQGVQ
jgi:uncharacterized protein (TIGR02145 family)